MNIRHSDSEVKVFHPICEEALNNALKNIGKKQAYNVLHHQYTGSLEMDFALRNTSTGKYLCVIEVKRTPSDIHSARYQYQAMSYVQMNSSENEKPFYCITNLEYAFQFRYDSQRPKVVQQMLQPGLCYICNFAKDNRDEIINKLTKFFEHYIISCLQNEYEYLVTLEQFAEHIERIKKDPRKWKSSLAILLYEYIRGAFTFINRTGLPDVRVYGNDIARICNEAARVNFKEIFEYNASIFLPQVDINNDELVNLFDFGNQNVNGDSIANIMHQIISTGHEHEGEVPTDLELARFVAVLARYISDDLDELEKLCDPAAGSGNLLSSAIDKYNINAKQVIANDSNKQLLELLSLRLGLNYARSVNRDNTPLVTNSNIANLESNYYKDVKVVVLNPPFLAGINCIERKQLLYSKVKKLAGEDTGTNIGQMPLEAIFLELITYQVMPGTTIACVFPKNHLLARGNEAKVIRKLLLSNFGLRVIYSYPGHGVFDDVTKETCVIVGKAMQLSETIEIISSYDSIPDIDLDRFEKAIQTNFKKDFTAIMPGVVAKSVTFKSMNQSVDIGWRNLNSEMTEAIDFVNQNFVYNDLLHIFRQKDWELKRGRVGNNGGSDLSFIDSRNEMKEFLQLNFLTLRAGMRNAKYDNFIVNCGDSSFFDISMNSDKDIISAIDYYLTLPERIGKQQRKTKSKEQLYSILLRESRGVFKKNSVLIPRGIRKIGRIYLANKDVFVSTNFIVWTLPNEESSILAATWMCTVFYQLICEISSKDQEGMRKMEIKDIKETYLPDFNNISEGTLDSLKNHINHIEFLELQNPKIRDIDIIWAKELFGENAANVLKQTIRLLGFLSTRRNG